MVSPNKKWMAKIEASGELRIVSVQSPNKVHWSHNKDSGKVPGPGPYKLMLTTPGNLELRDAKDAIYWESDSSDMGISPFTLQMRDDGALGIWDSRNTLVWATVFARSCEDARAIYKRQYGGDWADFLHNLKNKKEDKVWWGPKCMSCDEAAKKYYDRYPDAKQSKEPAAKHYVNIKPTDDRLWNGLGECYKPAVKDAVKSPFTLEESMPLKSPNEEYTVMLYPDGSFSVMNARNNQIV